MADVAAVRQAFGGTFNDVVLAAVTAGFRELLLSRGEPPTPHLIRSLVPVNVRAPGDEDILDNRVSLMLAELPVELDDPVRRLAAVQEVLGKLKARHEAEAGAVMLRAAGYPPYAVLAPVLRVALRLPQRTITTVTTNVPGPRRPLYLLGRRCLEIIPYVPIAVRLRLGVSMITYAGHVTFGITGDYPTAADVWTLAHGIEAGLAELVDAAAAAQASDRHGAARRG
jgi:diacylglycerol O-acyltransferase